MHPSTTAPPYPRVDSPSQPSPGPPQPQLNSQQTTTATSSRSTTAEVRHHSILPFTFRAPFASNQTSTTLVPSTAEGKPIPVDGSIAEHRTSALRELNSHYPSRYRYAKSTGAQSTTYSEPVIVRSYYAPAPSRGGNSTRRGVVIHHGQPTTATENAGSAIGVRRVIPFASSVSSAGNGMLSSMARTRAKKLLGAGAQEEEPKLPPVEAFSFKSFVANMEAQGDLSADLDRIAEICAKSRYSLSNQYEVHYQPHGSGSAFLNGGNGNQDNQGPTLQVVNPGDDRNMIRTVARRRGPGRRNSRAMGTLETIISSNRSSEEERARKKPALELAEEVRGRATTKAPASIHSTTTTSSHKSKSKSQSETDRAPPPPPPPPPAFERRNSTLALMEAHAHSTSKTTTPNEQEPRRNSSTGLLSQPALPQASTSQLEIRTAPEGGRIGNKSEVDQTRRQPEHAAGPRSIARDLTTRSHDHSSQSRSNIFLSLGNWIPWRVTDHGGFGTGGSGGAGSGRAEGSLRDLLRSIDGKGKGPV